jgi:hypothetical protein
MFAALWISIDGVDAINQHRPNSSNHKKELLFALKMDVVER